MTTFAADNNSAGPFLRRKNGAACMLSLTVFFFSRRLEFSHMGFSSQLLACFRDRFRYRDRPGKKQSDDSLVSVSIESIKSSFKNRAQPEKVCHSLSAGCTRRPIVRLLVQNIFSEFSLRVH